MQVDDFLYSYEEPIDPEEYQTYISSKYEFMEMGAKSSEATPPRGKYFAHQNFIHRYVHIYDKVLTIWETGTGKSCGAFGLSESLRRANLAEELSSYINDYMHPNLSTIKHIYVLVSGDAIAEELKKQIYCKCSMTKTYEKNPDVVSAETTVSRTRALLRILRQYYTVTSYGSFTKAIREGKLSDEKIKDKFSDCMFIIDEAHNLSYDPTKAKYEVEEVRELSGEISRRVIQRKTNTSGTHVYTSGRTVPDYLKDSEGNPIEGSISGTGKTTKVLTRFRKKDVHDSLLKLFDITDRIKVMALTATPIVNTVNELPMILNLVLDVDKRLPIADDYGDQIDYSGVSLDDLAEAAMGRISYVRALRNRAIPIEMGEPTDVDIEVDGEIYKSQTVLYRSVMSGRASNYKELNPPFVGQWEAFDAIMESRKGKVRSAFLSAERQASNFIFPDGSIGEAGFRKYVIFDKKTGLYMPSFELRPWISNIDMLRLCSAKFATIVELILNSTGKVFIFSNNKEGAGTILLTLCIAAQKGYTQYMPPKAKDVMRPLCSSDEVDVNYGTVRNGVGLLTSSMPKQKFRAMIDYYNHKSNIHGKYVRILVTSPVGKEGINVNNVKHIHIVDPSWNVTDIYQAKSRGIRVTSHDDLIAEEEAKIITDLDTLVSEAIESIRYYGQDFDLDHNSVRSINSLTNKTSSLYGEFSAGNVSVKKRLFSLYTNALDILSAEFSRLLSIAPQDYKYIRELRETVDVVNDAPSPQDIRIEIQIYQHAAIGPEEATDEGMYIEAERKDILMWRILRKLKQIAVDCQINKSRNVRDTDVDMSKECGYDMCDYTCYGKAPSSIDYSSYDVLYSDGEINTIIQRIKTILSRNARVSIEELEQQLRDTRKIIIDMSISKIVNDKVPVYDRYGVPSYIAEDGGSLFLQLDYPINNINDYTRYYYSSTLTGMLNDSIGQYNIDMERPIQEELISRLGDAFIGDTVDESKLSSILAGINIDTKSRLFEQIITMIFVHNTTNLLTKTIYERYKGFYFATPEPLEAIRLSNRSLSGELSKDGRRRAPRATSIIKALAKDQQAEDPSELIHVNTMLTVKGLESYNMSANFMKVMGTIRILKEGEGSGWRDAADFELPVYSAIGKQNIEQEIAEIEDRAFAFANEGDEDGSTKPIYATILPDKKFRIMDSEGRLSTGTKRKKGKKGGHKNRGTVCSSLNVNKVLASIFTVRVPVPKAYRNKKKDRKAMISAITAFGLDISDTDQINLETIEYWYQWTLVAQVNNRTNMCYFLKKHMVDNGLVFIRTLD